MSRRRAAWPLVVVVGGLASFLGACIFLRFSRRDDARLRSAVQSALDRYDFREARRLLGQSPGSSTEGELLRAQLARRSWREDFAEASSRLEQAERLGGAADRVRLERHLLSCQAQGPSLEVDAALRQHVRQHPLEAPLVYEAAARGLLRRGDLDGALACLDRWRHDAAGDWRQRLWRGAILEHLGRAELAIEQYQEIVREHPGQRMAARRLGLVLANTSYDVEQALQYLPTDTEAADADVHVARALCFRALGDLTRSRQLVETALRIEPGHFRGLQLLVLLELRAGRSDAALEILRRLEARQRPDRAQALQRLLAMNPMAFYTYDIQMIGETLHLKATALRRLGREAEAESCRRRLLELQDNAAKIKVLLAEEAPPDAERAYQLGSRYRRIGFTEDARQWLTRALSIEPGHSQARQELEELQNGAPP